RWPVADVRGGSREAGERSAARGRSRPLAGHEVALAERHQAGTLRSAREIVIVDPIAAEQGAGDVAGGRASPRVLRTFHEQDAEGGDLLSVVAAERQLAPG